MKRPENFLSVDEKVILDNVNQRLPGSLRLEDDDPTLVFLILLDEFILAYSQKMEAALIESHHGLLEAQRIEVERSKSVIHSLVTDMGEQLQGKLDTVGHAWETRLQASATYQHEQMRQTSKLVLVGASIILFCGALALGIIIGNFYF
jgi:hypothetical protein